jgi:hypothetical protein
MVKWLAKSAAKKKTSGVAAKRRHGIESRRKRKAWRRHRQRKKAWQAGETHIRKQRRKESAGISARSVRTESAKSWRRIESAAAIETAKKKWLKKAAQSNCEENGSGMR